MSTNYLRAFVESVADVPSELERWFRGMRELDERAHGLQVQLEADCQQQLRLVADAHQQGTVSKSTATPVSAPKRQRAAPPVSLPASPSAPAGGASAPAPAGALSPQQQQQKNEELTQRIERTTAELLKLSAEKTNAAQQIYDYVDQHIRKLDRDLRAFDSEIASERSKLGLPPADGGAVPAADDRRRKRKDGGAAAAPQQTSEELYRAALAAADASEPTYCYCHRISFGEMIACEHPECPTEWFHFECVGLTADNRPKGKWYCKDCRKLLGKK